MNALGCQEHARLRATLLYGPAMHASILDELRTSWPPDESDEDRGYRRVPVASLRPVDAMALPLAGGLRAAVVVVEGVDGLAALPLSEQGGRWRLAAAGDGASAALVRSIASEPTPPPFQTARLARMPVLVGER